MNTKPCLTTRCELQSQLREYQTTLRSGAPALASLLDILEVGGTPNFLDVMSALSDLVAFYTDHDTNSNDQELNGLGRSEKKCLFCS